MRYKVVWVALGASLIGACGNGDSPAAYCDRFCERVRECYPTSQTSGCVGSCESWRRDSPITPDAIDATADCTVATSCTGLDSGDYFSGCLDKAAPHLAATEHAVDACQAMEARDLECGYTPDTTECVDTFKMLKDNYLTQFEQCSQQPTCDETYACYEGVFQ